MNQRRKVTLAALFVMTLLLAGVSIFITIRIQQNNAAADANASGFGSTATTNKFGSVFQEFASYSCDAFLSNSTFTFFKVKPSFTSIQATTNNLDIFGSLPYLPVNCTYKISDTKSIDFLLHSYDTNSFIDDSEEALFTRINANLKSVIIKDYYGYVTMFFGEDNPIVSAPASSDITCRANLFHSQNDFEYAEIIYHGFGDCNSLVNDNQLIVAPFASQIILGMTNVNKKF